VESIASRGKTARRAAIRPVSVGPSGSRSTEADAASPTSGSTPSERGRSQAWVGATPLAAAMETSRWSSQKFHWSPHAVQETSTTSSCVVVAPVTR
jgi:hypothetical protein